MKAYIAFCLLILSLVACKKDEPTETPFTPFENEYYYPENFTGTWATLDPDSLGWRTELIPSLFSFLDSADTRAFIVLKNGKIVLEHYNGLQLNGQPFTRSSNWYWASAGKSLTAFTLEIAIQDGLIDRNAPTSHYLGDGWTAMDTSLEHQITVQDQLQMTTGLDDGGDTDCTSPTCLQFLSTPGTRWAYHNAPYTLLHDVLNNAAPVTFEEYVQNEILAKVGIGGMWFWVDNNHVFFSNARSMARFGLLNLSQGIWNNDTLLSNDNFTRLITPSQSLNPSYGELFWLNGQSSFMLPSSQVVYNGNLIPNAPSDMYSALGKNDQILSIVPSMGLVVVRMGDAADNSPVPILFHNEIWKRLLPIIHP